nr:tRNA1(Val) (adenine(37)-N6)-methyltransferase [Lachnospiraceae bacterium]
MTIKLLPNERLDDLGRKGYKIIQNPEKFCFGIDAVLLSEFSKVKSGKKVLDLGTGTGILPILLEAKTGASHLTGLEIQEESADMARRSVICNGLEDKISIVTGDIKEAGSLFGAASFDVITCNPPYMIGGHGLQNPSEAKMIARHEILCTFEDVARETAYMLKEGGNFYLVHRPFRLAEIISILVRYRLEPKRIRFVHPYIDKEPNMVLIEARKGGNARVTIERPLIIYKEKGVYSDEVLEVYKTPYFE